MFLSRGPIATLRKSATSAPRSLLRSRRGLLTLAIESSCDDTSVAIVEKQSDRSTGDRAKIHFLENITADSRAHRGIHPILALESHQENLADLVNKALQSLPASNGEANSIRLADGSSRQRPDFISATRGPGMRSNLSVGLDTGKALSVAWQIPMVGVHHMQAHLLTPRLVSCLENSKESSSPNVTSPQFPFLSILVSGGHSIIVHSKSLTDHKIMATSDDIAMGETLDKSAREIIPPALLQAAQTTMYGKTLEQFVFPNGPADFADYRPPMTRGEEVVKRKSRWGWSVTTPFANTRALQLSFSSVASMVGKIIKNKNGCLSDEERVDLGREAMRVCFEHLSSRTIIALEALRLRHQDEEEIKTLVVSGGVAANKFLMHVLRSCLDVRGFEHMKIVAPPPYLCTDNAAMIGWAGIEMFEAGWRTNLSCRAIRKWTLDPQADDGGVLGPSGWVQDGSSV
ncbi:putative O-sialoglycoprotein endopeptidase [Penicillium brasilianum]|uniref:N(6)-L-threonylcarbamoyladenine synthase n=1 Tax=Penicillium brasilianum TaxID=104259 RepID=A0A1S9REE8_PENBI|nr:putative O-sialoglycoprotein endopeptidase [Penicillium brasilianum]